MNVYKDFKKDPSAMTARVLKVISTLSNGAVRLEGVAFFSSASDDKKMAGSKADTDAAATSLGTEDQRHQLLAEDLQ